MKPARLIHYSTHAALLVAWVLVSLVLGSYGIPWFVVLLVAAIVLSLVLKPR